MRPLTVLAVFPPELLGALAEVRSQASPATLAWGVTCRCQGQQTIVISRDLIQYREVHHQLIYGLSNIW